MTPSPGRDTASTGGRHVSMGRVLSRLIAPVWQPTEKSLRVWALASKESTDLRTAALMEGIRRVAEGYKVRGLYP